MKIWSRRKFLEAGVISSIAMSSGAASISSAQGKKVGQTQDSATATPRVKAGDLLAAAIDEIIPASDGMPAASEVGGVDYLRGLSVRDAKTGGAIEQTLGAIENLSQNQFHTSFVLLSREQRLAVLTAMDKQDAGNFKIFCDSVYEAYYEQPQVWKLIDYTCYETNGGGPTPEPFNEQILSEVRTKPRFYREA